jgi:hypothetical protein
METPRIIPVRDLPYLSCEPKDGRSIVVAPYYDADSQQFYGSHPMPDGRIAVLPIGLVEGHYVAKCCANPESDRDLPFSTVVVQHFSYMDIWVVLRDVQNDLTNGLASLHKYFVILLYANEHDDDSYGPMVMAELEYAFMNHRAFYDRLHEIIRRIHDRYWGKGSNLPDSFARTANKSEQDLLKTHCLPPPLVDFYKGREGVFLKLKCVRDNIAHRGHSPDYAFLFPDGIAVSVDDRLAQELGDLGLWPEPLLKPNRLGSALAILAFVAGDMFDVMGDLGSRLLACFPDPPKPIARGYDVFLRSTVSKHLVSLDEYKRKHWFDPREVLGIATASDDAPA